LNGALACTRYAPQEILVLAQRRSVGNPIHDALTGRNIPSKSYYQEGALENQAAQERLATLKLVVNPQDRIALRWLLGFGSGNFRTGAYARIRARCEQTGMTPWDLMAALADGNLQIAHTHHLVARFKEIRDEIFELAQADNVQEFVELWLGEQVAADEPFQILARELSASAEAAAGLLEALIAAVSLPDVPRDVAEVRIMSLHKSKGLSSPVVIIAGCAEGLLPTRHAVKDSTRKGAVWKILRAYKPIHTRIRSCGSRRGGRIIAARRPRSR
jgi:DNA helicase II / ATP-dependent DNA helicase PcrA